MRDCKKVKVNIVAHIGVGGQKGYIYMTDGLIPCLPATQYKDPYKIILSTSGKCQSDSLEMCITNKD